MAKVLVLGGGMVGSVMAADLARERGMRVTVVDRSAEALERAQLRATRLREAHPLRASAATPKGPKSGRTRAGRSRNGSARGEPALRTIVDDASDPAVVRRLAADCDFVVGALPSRFGFETLRAVIDAGRSCVDISFMPEDFLELDRAAKKRGVTIVPDCGVAPGMSNMLAGWGADQLTKPTRVQIMVGGLPRERHWPFEYKAGFSPADVIEEYVRPSRIVRNGRIEVREALSSPELVTLPGAGTMEAFLTDGLRSLVHTLNVPHMDEKTLRYPGHIELMRVMRSLGLFSEDEIEVAGQRVRPRELTAALLFPKWTYAPDEQDLTVMRVLVEGLLGGKPTRLVWDLFDVFDPTTGFTSMSRTTGFPATAMARLILSGRYRERGVIAPERAALSRGVLSTILRDLAARGVHYVAGAEQMESATARSGTRNSKTVKRARRRRG